MRCSGIGIAALIAFCRPLRIPPTRARVTLPIVHSAMVKSDRFDKDEWAAAQGTRVTCRRPSKVQCRGRQIR